MSNQISSFLSVFNEGFCHAWQQARRPHHGQLIYLVVILAKFVDKRLFLDSRNRNPAELAVLVLVFVISSPLARSRCSHLVVQGVHDGALSTGTHLVETELVGEDNVFSGEVVVVKVVVVDMVPNWNG